VKRIKFLQRMFRHAYDLNHIVRQHVLLPQVWAMESLVIGEAAGIPEERIRSEIDAWLAQNEVEKWKQKAIAVGVARERTMQLHIYGAREEPVAEMTNMSSQVTTAVDGRRPSVASSHSATSTERGQRGRPAPGMIRMRKKYVEASMNHGSSTNTGEHIVAPEQPASLLKHMDSHRLSREQRDHVSQLIWRENADRWFQQYKSYKISMGLAWVHQAKWKLECEAIGLENQFLWPDPPEFPKYPEEIMKVHAATLKFHVTQTLRQGRKETIA